MEVCNFVCLQNTSEQTLSMPLVEGSTSYASLPPSIYNAISTLYIGALVLCAILFASWVIDWEACETTIDQKIRMAFPDNWKRREYMLKKVAEIDALEKRKREIEAKKDLARNILQDAVQLEREYEALTFEIGE